MPTKTSFSIDIPSAFYVEYREGGHVLRIEMDFRDEIPVLSHRALCSWEPPHEEEPIPEAKKSEILEAVASYLHGDRRFSFELQGGHLVPSRTFKWPTIFKELPPS